MSQSQSSTEAGAYNALNIHMPDRVEYKQMQKLARSLGATKFSSWSNSSLTNFRLPVDMKFEFILANERVLHYTISFKCKHTIPACGTLEIPIAGFHPKDRDVYTTQVSQVQHVLEKCKRLSNNETKSEQMNLNTIKMIADRRSHNMPSLFSRLECTLEYLMWMEGPLYAYPDNKLHENFVEPGFGANVKIHTPFQFKSVEVKFYYEDKCLGDVTISKQLHRSANANDSVLTQQEVLERKRAAFARGVVQVCAFPPPEEEEKGQQQQQQQTRQRRLPRRAEVKQRSVPRQAGMSYRNLRKEEVKERSVQRQSNKRKAPSAPSPMLSPSASPSPKRQKTSNVGEDFHKRGLAMILSMFHTQPSGNANEDWKKLAYLVKNNIEDVMRMRMAQLFEDKDTL